MAAPLSEAFQLPRAWCLIKYRIQLSRPVLCEQAPLCWVLQKLHCFLMAIIRCFVLLLLLINFVLLILCMYIINSWWSLPQPLLSSLFPQPCQPPNNSMISQVRKYTGLKKLMTLGYFCLIGLYFVCFSVQHTLSKLQCLKTHRQGAVVQIPALRRERWDAQEVVVIPHCAVRPAQTMYYIRPCI